MLAFFKARKLEWPKGVKAGSAVVKIYRVRHRPAASGYAYSVSFTQLDGKRALRQFAEESAALEESRLKAAQLSSGKVEAAEVDRMNGKVGLESALGQGSKFWIRLRRE